MSDSDLAPAGSSSYSSSTLHVGDGTWDNGRDTFLLPNLVGLNFDTMRYNGMGNRFANLPGYYNLILGHGILAAIVFLAVVPAAIFMAKFYRGDPRTAVKVHVYLQILTVFLLTVVFVLGYFAVGPERSLTNPHHGIGVAVYVLVLAQFLFGWVMSRLEKKRKDPMALTRIPKKVWVHKLLGRSIALLGIVQIALGLTLYGSPKSLFILFAIAGAFLVFGYLALDRRYYEERRVEWGVDGQNEFYSDYNSSYLSGTQTDFTQDRRQRQGRPPSREREGGGWGKKILAGAGALGAYEWWKHKRDQKRDRREERDYGDESVFDDDGHDRRYRGPPTGMASSAGPGMGPSVGPSGVSSQASTRPPPGVMYGAGSVPTGVESRAPPHRPRSRQARLPPTEESRLSPESWEDEKYSESQRPHTWRDRLLGAGAGIGAFAGIKSLLDRRNSRRKPAYEDDYREKRYRPPLGGNQNMVSQTDVSRVEAGDAPMSPPNARIAGEAPNTPSQTPSRPPRRPMGRSSMDSMSYDDEESFVGGPPRHHEPQHKHEEDFNTLRNSVATLGAIAGFREWYKRRGERKERQQADRLRRQDREDEERFNRRNSMHYPRMQDSHAGRRESDTGTLMTGVSGPAAETHGFMSSQPELSRTNFSQSRVDTNAPPLPANAGAVPSMGPSTMEPGYSQQHSGPYDPNASGYHLPPPPPGPPPHNLQMPPGAVNPDPNRLMSHEDMQQSGPSEGGPYGSSAAAATLAGGAAASSHATNRQRRASHSQSPSRFGHSGTDSQSRLEGRRPDENAIASTSQVHNSTVDPSASGAPNPVGSPPVSVKMHMHRDGQHVTLRRLSEEEAAAERTARRQERMERRSARQRTRRGSSLSSGQESDAAPPGSNAKYRRHGGGNGKRHRMRDSSQQPYSNVPAPPASLSTIGSGTPTGRRQSSELNLPPAVPAHGVPQTSSAGGDGASPPVAPANLNPPISGSGMSGTVGSPGDAGTGTDLSTFDNNRRRRRAERARRLEAAQGRGNRVEFE
ncbi:hypothetical protein KC333_g5240 [Hortaea werneckii]|nr:hypothetical protein KC333_g5240 [Hortaea werneckii]KAI7321870.1 hypothetical protein KC326_g2036 [Hortaea werneckii]